MGNLSKVLAVPIVYLPAIIMLIVSHSLDLQGLWIYYVAATGLIILIFSGKLESNSVIPVSIFCTKCGNKNKTNTGFCTKCGNKI